TRNTQSKSCWRLDLSSAAHGKVCRKPIHHLICHRCWICHVLEAEETHQSRMHYVVSLGRFLWFCGKCHQQRFKCAHGAFSNVTISGARFTSTPFTTKALHIERSLPALSAVSCAARSASAAVMPRFRKLE